MQGTAHSEALSQSLVALCGSLSTGGPWTPDPALRREPLRRLIARHGLIPDPAGLPERDPLSFYWTRRRQIAAAEALRARRQLRELGAAFAEGGVRWMLLRGTAALLWLYGGEPGREPGDLELLVSADTLPAARASLAALGYAAAPAGAPAGYEAARPEEAAAELFRRRDSLPLQVHAEGSAPGAGEWWAGAVAMDLEGVPVPRPDPVHFLLDTMLQYHRDMEADVAAARGLLDLLLAAETGAVDWVRLWRTAGRWGLAAEAAAVTATLRLHWGAPARGIPPGAAPIAAGTLAYGLKNAAELTPAALPAAYWRRLARVRRLPGALPRARYLFRLLFPSPENLRARYRLPRHGSLLPYYLLHPLVLAARLGRGVCAAAARGPAPLPSRREGRSGLESPASRRPAPL